MRVLSYPYGHIGEQRELLELAESLQQGSKSEKLISFHIKTFYYRVCFVAIVLC